MRICVLSDCVFPTPMPDGHGLGLMTAQVAEGLHDLGHDVTLIAKHGSSFSGTLHTPAEATGYEGELYLARDALRLHRQWAFDVFLDNGHLHLLADMFPHLPVVNVYHDKYQDHRRNAVLLSEGQRALMSPAFDSAWIIPNTLDANTYIPLEAPFHEEFVLFMGAKSEIKQPVLAIEACAKAGKKLVMAGADIVGRFPNGTNENVKVMGAVKGDTKHALLRNARVFLQLGIGESFGLTTLEANLCATPVVGWASGGTLNLIQYGINGVFVSPSGDSAQAVADGIERAWDMDRRQVRQYAETLCNVPAQIHAYEEALIATIEGRRW